MWELDHKRGWAWRIDAFKLWYWWRHLRVPARSNQSSLKEINPEYSLKGLTLKLHYFGHLMRRTNSLEKTLMLGKIEDKRRRGWQEEKMVGWHHWLSRHEFEQAPGDSEGQGSLACCSPWDGERVTGRKARGLQRRRQATSVRHFFLISPLSSRRKQTTSVRFFFFSQWMLHEEATACVAVAQPLWLFGAYDPRDRLEKPVFLYLFVSCPPSHPVFNHP